MNDFPPTTPHQPGQGDKPSSSLNTDRRESHWIKTVAIICVIGLAAVLFWPSDKPPTDIEKSEPSTEATVDIEQDGAMEPADEEETGFPDEQPESAGVVEEDAASPTEHEDEPEAPEPQTPSGQPTQADVPTPAPRFAAPPASSGDYFVQVGSFARPENAKILSDALSPAWPVRIVPTPTGWHRVQVGPFDSRPAAAEALATLKHTHKLEGFIAKHD